EESNWETKSKSKEQTKSLPTDRNIKEVMKRLKVVYEDEGLDFGSDPEDADTLVDRFTVATNLRKKRIEEVFRLIRRARAVQLCFLVDVTGSMTPHLEAVKVSILDIVNKLTSVPSG
ncbi:hypothetical protein PFISCL1PPCAC_7344, partial [Pristionchus fissidentatus]